MKLGQYGKKWTEHGSEKAVVAAKMMKDQLLAKRRRTWLRGRKPEPQFCHRNFFILVETFTVVLLWLRVALRMLI